MKNRLLPINILVIFLQVLALWSSYAWSGTDVSSWAIQIRNLALLFTSGLLIRFLIVKGIDPQATFRLEHRIITTLILFLLFDSFSPWWVFFALGVVTEACQYFFRTTGGPLWNPAALGTLILSIFGFFPSWWGVNPAPRIPLFGEEISIIAFFTLACAGYVAYRYRKLAISVAALVAFSLVYTILFGQNPLYIALEGTLLFFLLVMVPEPKTSPNTKKEQIVYGMLVGSLVAIGLFFHFIEAYVIALLIGNLYNHRRFLWKLLPLTKEPKSGTVAI